MTLYLILKIVKITNKAIELIRIPQIDYTNDLMRYSYFILLSIIQGGLNLTPIIVSANSFTYRLLSRNKDTDVEFYETTKYYF